MNALKKNRSCGAVFRIEVQVVANLSSQIQTTPNFSKVAYDHFYEYSNISHFPKFKKKKSCNTCWYHFEWVFMLSEHGRANATKFDQSTSRQEMFHEGCSLHARIRQRGSKFDNPFFSWCWDRESKYHINRPSSAGKRNAFCVSLADRWWPNIECWLW